jgi:hypothetical protein
MSDRLRALRDTVNGRDREVEVSPDGEVREVRPEGETEGTEEREAPRKPTKLAKRFFGHDLA